MRLLIVQYAGDFKAAVENFERGGCETYGSQKYSVDAVIELGKTLDSVGVLCCQTGQRYDEVMSNGVRVIGAGFSSHVDSREVLRMVKEYRPTHLVMRTPMPRVMAWAAWSRMPTIAILADCFPEEQIKDRIKNLLLARCFNHRSIEWVFNHGINSCRALTEIGVRAEKIVPWDWPPGNRTPAIFAAKEFPLDSTTMKLFYAGMVIETKGIGDLLDAIGLLRASGVRATLQVAGNGEIDAFSQRAQKLGIQKDVQFLGMVPNDQVMTLMNRSDLVIVPSRHEYPEGLPLTIYEAFCSHTPIIASDHPMFRNRLVDECNSIIFKGGNATSLADSIVKIWHAPALYERLSAASAQSWENLQVPVKWAQILTHWISNSADDQKFFMDHALSSGRYR